MATKKVLHPAIRAVDDADEIVKHDKAGLQVLVLEVASFKVLDVVLQDVHAEPFIDLAVLLARKVETEGVFKFRPDHDQAVLERVFLARAQRIEQPLAGHKHQSSKM